MFWQMPDKKALILKYLPILLALGHGGLSLARVQAMVDQIILDMFLFDPDSFCKFAIENSVQQLIHLYCSLSKKLFKMPRSIF